MPTISLDVCVANAPQVTGGAAVSNLLRWTEEFDNAVWVASGVTVIGDAVLPPAETSRADQLVFSADGVISQTSQTAAATGSSVTLSPTLTNSWVRYDKNGTFDGLAYDFSLWVMGDVGGEPISLALARVGGFLTVQIFENASIGGTIYVSGAQLEQAGSAGTYTLRTT